MRAEASGLLIGGQYIQIPGLTIMGPGDAPWCKLEPQDYMVRSHWIRQIILHTTNGTWPHHIKPGKGPGGRDKQIAEWWSKSKVPGGAHLVVDNDSSVACLVDLVRCAAFHATVSNPWSIGIEMFQESDGGIYEAVFETTAKLVHALCGLRTSDKIAVPFQIPSRTYNGHPMQRMLRGGPDMCGVFGHRDNTENRGQGDPGDYINVKLLELGAKPLDFERGEDLELWKRRQAYMNSVGEALAEDGIAGPATLKAARKHMPTAL